VFLGWLYTLHHCTTLFLVKKEHIKKKIKENNYRIKQNLRYWKYIVIFVNMNVLCIHMALGAYMLENNDCQKSMDNLACAVLILISFQIVSSGGPEGY
jgi:hypothetical protein